MNPRNLLATLSLSAIAALAGCGATTSAPPGPDAAVAQDGPADAPPADVPPPPTDVAGDAPPPSDRPVGTCETAPVRESPSVASVRFRLASGGGWVVTRGAFCAPFSVERVGGGPVALGTGFQCVCECPNPGPARVETAQRPSMTTELTWDGREVATCTRAVDCATRGFPGSVVLERQGASRPVTAGRYRATFAVLDELPAGCTARMDGTASCSTTPGFPSGSPPSSYDRCPSSRTVSVEFDLPASGEAVVNVP